MRGGLVASCGAEVGQAVIKGALIDYEKHRNRANL